MPDYGERPAEENERMLETASCRDPPPINYGAQMLERPQQQQQQHQQQSVGRKTTGGIMSLPNYKGCTVNIRAPKWEDSQLWIKAEDFESAQYIADAAFYLTGRAPVHFPDAKFGYLPLLLSTGELLTTREKCLAHMAKIAKGSALLGQRKDFKERAQKLILEMVKGREAVQFLNIMRANPRQVWQPRLKANPGTDSPFTDDENGTAVELDNPIEEAIQALASTVTANPSQYGNLVPLAIPEETHSVITDDGGEENGTPMEVDSLSEEAIQALAPTGTVDAASVFQFDGSMTSFSMDVDISTSFIPIFEMDLDEPENFLTSAGQSLGGWHRRFGEEKEDLVPDNYKEFMASLDKDEEETWKSTEPSDWEICSPLPPFVPHSPLLGTALPGSGWHSRGTTSGADANEALRPPVRPILCQNRWRP